ncbi:hydroxypyruvate isomerase family protein [Nocardia sp. NPDC101769]|uniref:hydroxypyruvate isomerase family protein n=1 Tax=Nocardia sp. NPDC101769 TaxID=3364333 RepID=UPI00380E1B93
MKWAANLSMLYSRLPVDQRAAAAARDGYAFVETWWPFDESAPTAEESDRFCSALRRAGVRLAALNLDAGDPSAGERGLLTDPGHEIRVRTNLESAVEILAETKCTILNALYGNWIDGHDPGYQGQLALRRLVGIADRVAELGVTVVVETLNSIDSPQFPLTDIDDTAALVTEAIAQSGHGNIGLLLDTYHLRTMGVDPAIAIGEYGPLIRHVQFADAPGRGRPGTGHIDFDCVTKALAAIGYSGFIGLEYDPSPQG